MISIRQALERDIPRILELYRQLAFNPSADIPDFPPEEYRPTFSRMLAVPGYELLVAETDGKIVATTVLAILPGLAYGGSPFAVIEYVVVDGEYRRQGIGRALMDHAISKSKEAGCYKIMLTSDNRRDDAHKFYRALGFEASAHGFRLYF